MPEAENYEFDQTFPVITSYTKQVIVTFRQIDKWSLITTV